MIEDVRKLCLALIERRGEVPLSVAAEELAKVGFRQLSRANVHEVLSTLFFDGLVRPLLRACARVMLRVAGGLIVSRMCLKKLPRCVADSVRACV